MSQLEWYRKRAFEGIYKIGEGKWDYSDSLLLYLPGSDEKYEAIQEVDTPYNTLVTKPERAYLEQIAPQVVAELPDIFEYIDLGPGTEHKEQFIFNAAKAQGKKFVYKPVDISDMYLGLAQEHVSRQGIEVAPIRSSFEELAEKLGESTGHRFVSIGLTYGNYDPKEILSLLKKVAAGNGTIFINAQIKERTDLKAIQSIYREVGVTMVAAKMELIGINPNTDISGIEVTDGIQLWYTLKNSPSELEGRGVKAGDKLLVFQSIRPSLEKLEADVAAEFRRYQLLDTGDQFVGALLK